MRGEANDIKKEQNRYFRIGKFSNRNKKLSGWFQYQNGEDKGKNH